MPPPNTPEEGLPGSSTPAPIPSGDAMRDIYPIAIRRRSPVNIQALEYVDPVDQELICPICRDPLVRPFITKCDHTFCFACIYKAWVITPFCPTDRTPLHYPDDVVKAPKIISNQLGNLKVRCPHASDGCTEILHRSEVEDHVVKLCPYFPLPCPDANCNRKAPRREAEKGATGVCLHFSVPCDYCERPVEYLSMHAHLDHDCPKSHQSCQHCNKKFPRSVLEQHETECEDAMVPCARADVGCPVVTRKRELATHLQSCPYTLLEKLGTLVAKQQEQINQLQKRDRERERRLKALEFHTIQSPYTDCAHPSRAATTSSSITPVGTLAGDGLLDENALHHNPQTGSNGAVPPPYESMDQYLLALYESSEAKMDLMQKSLSDLEGRQTVMLLNETMPIKDQLAEMRSQLGVQGMHVRWLMNFRLQERSRNMTGSFTGIAGPSASSNAIHSSNGADNGNGDEIPPFGRRLSDTMREHPPRL